MKSTVKRISIIVIIFLLCLFLFTQVILPVISWGLSFIPSYCEWRFQWPDSGTYYCSELNAFLHFEPAGDYFSYGDMQKIPMHIGFDGVFFVYSEGTQVFSTDYFWNQRRDELKLTSVTFLGEDFGRKTYTFLRYDEDS